MVREIETVSVCAAIAFACQSSNQLGDGSISATLPVWFDRRMTRSSSRHSTSSVQYRGCDLSGRECSRQDAAMPCDSC